jgi:hypothetical protein
MESRDEASTVAGVRAALRAARIAVPILLVAAALAALWVEAPARAEPEDVNGVAPPAPSAPKPPSREVTYEPWELVKT